MLTTPHGTTAFHILLDMELNTIPTCALELLHRGYGKNTFKKILSIDLKEINIVTAVYFSEAPCR
jgi:hypothetical protein